MTRERKYVREGKEQALDEKITEVPREGPTIIFWVDEKEKEFVGERQGERKYERKRKEQSHDGKITEVPREGPTNIFWAASARPKIQ